MNLLGEIAGEICKVLLPISDRVYRGNQNSSVAVCTLSSMALLEEIASSHLMSRINVAGRLLSENRGIETLVRQVISNEKILVILLCGRETAGHRSGHSLLCLHHNGIECDGRIIGSQSPDPFLSLSEAEVERFQDQVTIMDRRGEEDIRTLESEIQNLDQ